MIIDTNRWNISKAFQKYWKLMEIFHPFATIFLIKSEKKNECLAVYEGRLISQIDCKHKCNCVF